mmetsp:Transcript_113132/g.225279  ORF Transcript_113132/g.225279 Transcript_113132/m.225279 type:complete len:203 (+) Transcript_113132:34-642(+)
MGGEASAIRDGGLTCAVDCKGARGGDGFPEQIENDDYGSELDGDVKNSTALTNHKLLKAARDGDTEGIMKMLGKGAYIETRRPFVMTPESVSTSDSAIVTRGTGMTPLMYAAQGGYEQACSLLLEKGACANSQDEDGTRPLHFAASSGSLEACKSLLAGGAEPDARDDDGLKAIDHVSRSELSTPAERRLWLDALGVVAQTP